MTTTLTSTHPDELFSTSGHAAYDQATSAFNLAAPPRPAAAVVARTVDDVSRAVRAARQAGLHVRVQSTGHSAGTQAPMTDSALIRTSLDRQVRVDPVARTARITAGTRWGAVVEAAAPYGLVALHGSSPTVGAVGYLLRGGLSFYGRHLGVAGNHVRSITLVLADGQQVEVSDSQHSELFWALRGGGGGFGIVTEIEIDLFPMAQIITGAVFWDARRAETIAPLWRTWAAGAPSAASTSLRLMNLPPLPGIPTELTRGQVLALDGAVLIQRTADLSAATAIAADLLDPLRDVATPLLDTWHLAQPDELPLTHMDPPDPLPYRGEHALLNDPGDEGLERILQAAGPGSGSVLAAVELRQLGGAFRTPPRTGGAFDRTDADLAYVGLGIDVPGVGEKVRDDLNRVRAATTPWRTGYTAPTFVESHDQQQRTFDDATAARVALIRRTVDPDGVFADDVAPIRDRAS